MDWKRVAKIEKDQLGNLIRRFLKDLTFTNKLILFGVLVGIAAGIFAFVFDRLIVLFSSLTIAKLDGLPFWERTTGLLLIPAVGACLGGVIIHRFCPGWRGHGTNEVLDAIQKQGGHIEGRVAWVKSVASALTIGFGGSAGREGPVIQIGAAAGSWVGQVLRVSTEQLRLLAAAGAAAGLAAAFGTPLTAVFFTMEVVLKDFASESFAAVVIASVTGVATARFMLGGERFLFPLSYTLSGPVDIFLFAILGLLCAPFGIVYMYLLNKVEHAFETQVETKWFLPAAGGILVGAIAIVFPRVLGTGQHAINEALRGQISNPRMGALSLLKIVATAGTLGTGGSGGAMMPSLFIGAMAGAAWGGFCHAVFGLTLNYGAYALVGLSCVFTAAYQAPVTAMVLALEISQDYDLLLPVMIACVVAHLASRRHRAAPTIER